MFRDQIKRSAWVPTRDEWIGRTGQEWARRGDALDLLLGPAADAGLDALSPRPGERILDLGCGAGASTEALARAVVPTGSVTAIDVSPDLIALARKRLEGNALVNLLEADAQTHSFEHHGHDALYSRFGSMFFEDPHAAFANLNGTLKPGARAVFVAWSDPSRNQWASVPMTFAAEGLGAARPPSGPGPFAWAAPETFHEALGKGGFSSIRETELEFMAEISEGTDPDPVTRAVNFLMKIGSLAARLRGASEEAKAEARAFLQKRLARHVRDDAVRLLASAWIIEARA
jgi:SAM-dependent methyltransferase